MTRRTAICAPATPQSTPTQTSRASTRTLRRGSGDIAAFVPFTRDWCVERFFDSLVASDVPIERVRLVVYVDSDDATLLAHVERRALATSCAEVVVHCSAWAPPAEKCRSRERRGRHAAMRCASVGLIPRGCDYLLLLEDDTTVPANTWERLSAALDAGYDWVSGYEIGRWSCPCPGIWDMSTPSIRRSATPGTGLEDCDATGVYLVLTTPEVYCSRAWDVWDNAYGHDVSITWMMKQAGLRIGVDWSLECVHMTQDGDLTVDMSEPSQNTRPLPPFTPSLQRYPDARPLTAFQPSGPRLAGRSFPQRDRIRSTYKLGIEVTLAGTVYPAGSRVSRDTARAMSEAGLIAAQIP